MEPVVDWSARVTDPSIQIELRSALAAAIAELPEAYRVPLRWHDVDGLSSAEVPDALDIALATVRSRLHRARMLGAGLPEVLADLFVSFDVATARGYFAVKSGAVRELTGSDPQSLAEFLQSRKELLLGRKN